MWRSFGFEDGAFDFVVVHQGLHHCHSPHRGLLEMYRVARRGGAGVRAAGYQAGAAGGEAGVRAGV